MSSTLCAASKIVSAQEKRKCNGAKPKALDKKGFTLKYKIAHGRTKVHTRRPSHTKPGHGSALSSSHPAISKDKAVGNVKSRQSCHRTLQNSADFIQRRILVFPRKSLSLLKWRGFSKIQEWKSLLGFSKCISMLTLMFKIPTCFAP